MLQPLQRKWCCVVEKCGQRGLLCWCLWMSGCKKLASSWRISSGAKQNATISEQQHKLRIIFWKSPSSWQLQGAELKSFGLALYCFKAQNYRGVATGKYLSNVLRNLKWDMQGSVKIAIVAQRFSFWNSSEQYWSGLHCPGQADYRQELIAVITEAAQGCRALGEGVWWAEQISVPHAAVQHHHLWDEKRLLELNCSESAAWCNYLTRLHTFVTHKNHLRYLIGS